MKSLVIKYTIMKIRFFSLILLMVSALSIQADEDEKLGLHSDLLSPDGKVNASVRHDVA